MTMESATRNLRDEHLRILEVVGVLDRVLDPTASTLDLPAIEGCVEFFRLFTDACHHGKEEEVLFPELVARGMQDDQGPIAVMLYEHEVGRALVRRMAAAAERLARSESTGSGDTAARDELELAGREYISLIRNHILKEDGVLFEMADRMLEGPACQRVCGTYHEICGRRFDGRTHADLEALAARLLEAYPPEA